MKTLLVSSVLPWPLRRNGGGQRTKLLVDALARHGRVDVVGVGGPELTGDVKDRADLAAHNVVGAFDRAAVPGPLPAWAVSKLRGVAHARELWLCAYRRDEAISAFVRDLHARERYDLVVARYLAPALRAGVPELDAPRKLLDFDDIDWQAFDVVQEVQPWAGLGGRVGAALVARGLAKLRDRGAESVDRAWVTCAEDAALLAGTLPSVEVLPNLPLHPEPAPSPASPETRDAMFVGDLQFPPNVNGLDAFLRDGWPRVVVRVPGARLKVYGRGLADAKRAEWSAVAGVDVIGFAPSLEAAYAGAALAVVPTFTGGGTKIKVLEALSFGRVPVVARHALRGYASLEPHLRTGATAAAMGDAVAALLLDRAARDALAASGQAAVRSLFGMERFTAQADKLIGPAPAR